MQARELFNLWKKHLESDKLYDQVMREAQDVNSYLNTEAQEELAKETVDLTNAQKELSQKAVMLSVVATVGLALVLTVSALGMNIVVIDGVLSGSASILFISTLLVSIGILVVVIWQADRLGKWTSWLFEKGKAKSVNHGSKT